MINEGVCGDTSLDGRNRIIPILARLRPEVLLILFGTNDPQSGIGAAVENLRFMIRAAQSRGATPVIGTLTPVVGDRERFIVSLNEQIRRLAAAERIAIADHYRALADNPQFHVSPEALLTPDGLHPNSSGYNLMAVVWSRAIREARGGPQAAPRPSGR